LVSTTDYLNLKSIEQLLNGDLSVSQQQRYLFRADPGSS